MKIRSIAGGALALLVATGVGACGKSEVVNGPEQWNSMVFVTYPGDGTGPGDGALLAGTVIVENGCLVIQDAADARAIPAIPAGQVAGRGDDTTVFGVSLKEGDVVEFGGGFGVDASNLTIPEPCRGLDYDIFTVHSMGK